MAKGVVDLRGITNALLADYGVLVKDILDEQAEKTAKETAKAIRDANMQVGDRADYAKDWAAKEEVFSRLGSSWIVYNKKHYQVAHLLENPHEFATKKGGQRIRLGFWQGESIIADAESSAQTKYLENCVRALEAAGKSPKDFPSAKLPATIHLNGKEK